MNGWGVEQWIELEPLDTLFFRGGEPMNAGETHEAGMPSFPPLPTTVIGALRTAILAQNGIDPKILENMSEDADLDSQNLPLWGSIKRPGFSVCGPLLVFKNPNGKRVVLFPAPVNWFYRERNKEEIYVHEAKPLAESENFPVKSNAKKKLLWVLNPDDELEPMAGKFWVTFGALAHSGNFELKTPVKLVDISSDDEPIAVRTELIVKVEERIGIARDNKSRAAIIGHLYAARHIRLAEGVSLLLGVDKPLIPSHLNEGGIFQLGGEGRMVRYRLLDEIRVDAKSSGRLLVLSHVPWRKAKTCGLLNAPYASSKFVKFAGWDMKKKFHKPVSLYFPVGTVFFRKDNVGLCELMPF